MNKQIKKYLSEIGRRGGKISRRKLASDAARTMVSVREAKRAYQQYHALCFWSYDPNMRVTAADIPWVAEQLRKHGNRQAWEKAAKLCP